MLSSNIINIKILELSIITIQKEEDIVQREVYSIYIKNLVKVRLYTSTILINNNNIIK